MHAKWAGGAAACTWLLLLLLLLLLPSWRGVAGQGKRSLIKLGVAWQLRLCTASAMARLSMRSPIVHATRMPPARCSRRRGQLAG